VRRGLVFGPEERFHHYLGRCFAGFTMPNDLGLARVAAMRRADDLFFDIVSQIRMPGWSRGRVALVGDAAYAPSFLSGQGSSLALVGAYVLAGELAITADHAVAFAAYEGRMREFVRMNQGLAAAGGVFVAPRTVEELALRNQALRDPAGLPGDDGRAANSALALPAYAHAG
jgi:2-polyprenyl-6-methoxyphenol hydroxylase-like FAD-dependent oxidoreductase